MADEKQNEQEFDDLLADFHIAQAKKAARQANTEPTAVPDAKPADTGTSKKAPQRPVPPPAPTHMPKKPDGTPYSIAELRQIQASRQAMQAYPGLRIVFSGGVASNAMLREVIRPLSPIFSQPQFSTDNAMGVAVLAHRATEA